MASNKLVFTLQQLADYLELRVHGQPDCNISSIATIQYARSGQICFLANSNYKKFLKSTQASAVILHEKNLEDCVTNALISADPYLSYAKLTKLFSEDNGKQIQAMVHPSAQIDETAVIHESVSIGANCVIGPRVILQSGVKLGAACVLGENCELAEDVMTYANVTLYANVKIGARSTIHSGAVIGADGFGFAKNSKEQCWEKIHQFGGVEIGEDVEIGANVTIDCGAIENTKIGNHVKIDNQVQIGHNVEIGDATLIAGCTGISGSSSIGANCIIGGDVGIVGHIEITDSVMVTGGSAVNKSINKPGIYSSGLTVSDNLSWRKNVTRFHQLDRIAKRIDALEKSNLKRQKNEYKDV